MIRVQQQLDEVITKHSSIRNRKRKNIAANVVELEFPFNQAARDNLARASHSGTLQFDDHDPFDASFITFPDQEEPIARMIHKQSSNFELPGMLKPLLLAYCEFNERWILCYDHFQSTLNLSEHLPATRAAPGLLHSWWCRAIRNALITIKEIHQKHYTHTALHDGQNYIIQSGCLKIVNLMGEKGSVDDPSTIARKVQDLKDFGSMLTPRLADLLTDDAINEDCRRFFAWFAELTVDNYSMVIDKLIMDPFLMSTKERFQYFAAIGTAIKKPDHPLRAKLDNEVFSNYKEWESGGLSRTVQLKAIFETPREPNGKPIGDSFDGKEVEDLIRFIKNAYMHNIQDGSYSAVDTEIREQFGGLLSHLHGEYVCGSTEDCECVLCNILRKGFCYKDN